MKKKKQDHCSDFLRLSRTFTVYCVSDSLTLVPSGSANGRARGTAACCIREKKKYLLQGLIISVLFNLLFRCSCFSSNYYILFWIYCLISLIMKNNNRRHIFFAYIAMLFFSLSLFLIFFFLFDENTFEFCTYTIILFIDQFYDALHRKFSLNIPWECILISVWCVRGVLCMFFISYFIYILIKMIIELNFSSKSFTSMYVERVFVRCWFRKKT